MYLSAMEIPESSVLTNWKGREGKFVRTFGMNSKRNRNEWRATWDSIKKYIHTALQLPGIEYEVCRAEGCHLDHVDADTFAESIAKQRPFERTSIIDYVLDEEHESVDLVHEVKDDAFWERLKKREIRYVSPLIWPLADGVRTLGTGRIDLPIIDVDAWKFVHHAFLDSKPAYGESVATVKTMCDGKNCDVKMLAAKQADTATANSENIQHLQEVPLLYRHKGQLTLLSASPCVQKAIKKKKDRGITIDDRELAIAHSECDSKSSFKTCTCKSRQPEMDESEHNKQMKANEDKVKELEAKLKAQDDKNDKEKSHAARKGRYAKLFADTEEKDRQKMVASLRANDDDKDDLKAAMEVDEDMKRAKKANTDYPEKHKLEARVSVLEAEKADLMITDLVALKHESGLGAKDVNEYHASLKGKTYDEIKNKYDDNKFEIKNLKASATPDAGHEFVFNGADMTALKGRTFSEIAEAGA
jgi:hypothetical protein